MIGAILQPTYMPWLGYFEMIDSADIFIAYDHVQFARKSWHQRNRIKDPNGEVLLTIPVKKMPLGTALCEIELASEYRKALYDHWVTISHAYKKSLFFDHYFSIFNSLFMAEYDSLMDLNISFIKCFCDLLKINTPIVKSSGLNLDKSIRNQTLKIIDICLKSKIQSLYDANGAQDIIDTKIFAINKIDISFQNFCHPIYRQQFGNFLPQMSVLDLIFNEGPNSLNIIRSGKLKPIENLRN